jgi:holliday junction DNA helicase RuvA
MIASLDGSVTSIGTDAVVLKVAGVGYRVSCGPGTLAGLTLGKQTELHIHHLVREDLQALYGFRTADELGFFELLITVTGVGPKVGLAIISSRPVADLQLAIVGGDEAVLTAVSGVGKRLAGRIVLELKEKVAAGGALGSSGAPGVGSSESEVMGALQALGYTPNESREAARVAVAGLPAGASLEDRVKAALNALRHG